MLNLPSVMSFPFHTVQIDYVSHLSMLSSITREKCTKEHHESLRVKNKLDTFGHEKPAEMFNYHGNISIVGSILPSLESF